MYMGEEEKKETTPTVPVVGGDLKLQGKEEMVSPLKSLLKTSDVLLMLYPKDLNGNFSASINPSDEIVIYKLLRDKKDTKKNLLILLDTSGGNVYSAVKIMDT